MNQATRITSYETLPNLMERFEPQGLHDPISQGLTSAMITREEIGLFQRIKSMASGANPRGAISFVLDGLMDVKIIEEGVLPHRPEDLHQVPDAIRPLNDAFSEQHQGEHSKYLFAGFQIKPIGGFVAHFPHKSGMPERIMKPPQLFESIK
jgi:hypothetical protein